MQLCASIQVARAVLGPRHVCPLRCLVSQKVFLGWDGPFAGAQGEVGQHGRLHVEVVLGHQGDDSAASARAARRPAR